jgi:hypothetical protein
MEGILKMCQHIAMYIKMCQHIVMYIKMSQHIAMYIKMSKIPLLVRIKKDAKR